MKNPIPNKIKKIQNCYDLIIAVEPIKFEAKQKISKGGDGIIYNAVDVVNNNTYRLNSIFKIIFFILFINSKKLLINKINSTKEYIYLIMNVIFIDKVII